MPSAFIEALSFSLLFYNGAEPDRSMFYSYAAASLVQQPLSSNDKQAVGEALTKALHAMQDHSGSKWEACAEMFPQGQPPADQTDPTWVSCKTEFVKVLIFPKSSVDKRRFHLRPVR